MKFIFFIVLLCFFTSVNAAVCVDTDVNDYVILTNQAIENCTTLVLMDKGEFTRSTSLTDILTMSKSDYEELAKAFLILLCLAVSIKVVMRFLLPK